MKTTETTQTTVNYSIEEHHPEYGCRIYWGTVILEEGEGKDDAEICDFVLNLHDKYRIMFDHTVTLSGCSDFLAWTKAYQEIDHDYVSHTSTWEKIEGRTKFINF